MNYGELTAILLSAGGALRTASNTCASCGSMELGGGGRGGGGLAGPASAKIRMNKVLEQENE